LRAGRIAATALATTVVTVVIATIASPPPSLLLWNATASVAVGLYVVTCTTPKRGDLLAIGLPPALEAFAVSRAILSPNTPILKPVAAVAGDRVCRFGSAVTINGRSVATARWLDRYSRSLPIWQGCQRLSRFQVFLLAPHPHSFDSRYFGPLHLHLARGVVHALLTLPQ
jgi:type IV secretory pathway protease TraF